MMETFLIPSIVMFQEAKMNGAINTSVRREVAALRPVIFPETLPHRTYEKGEVSKAVWLWYKRIFESQDSVEVKAGVSGRGLYSMETAKRGGVVL